MDGRTFRKDGGVGCVTCELSLMLQIIDIEWECNAIEDWITSAKCNLESKSSACSAELKVYVMAT